MYKIALYSIVCCLGLVFATSCEGRRTPSQSLEKNISEYKKQTNLKKVLFIPENYTERVTDTLLSNGIHIELKVTSDMNRFYKVQHKDNTVMTEANYRHFTVNLHITKQNSILFHKRFNYSILKELPQFSKSNTEAYTLMAAYVDEESTLFNNQIHLKLHFKNQDTFKESVFNLLVAENGTYTLSKYHART